MLRRGGIGLWRNGEATFASRMITSRPFSFASHSFDIVDSLNQNADSQTRRATIRLIHGWQSPGPTSAGRLRTADESPGRDYGWFEALILVTRRIDELLSSSRRAPAARGIARAFDEPAICWLAHDHWTGPPSASRASTRLVNADAAPARRRRLP